jgi:predicted acyl esterase
MHRRALPLLLALGLVASTTACDITSFKVATFRFDSPKAASLVSDPASEFVLGLPKYRSSLRIWLDGAPLPAGAWTETPTEARGTIGTLSAGSHTLHAEATLTVLWGGVPIVVSTERTFESAAMPGFSVRESVEQLHVTHATPGDSLDLWDADDHVVQNGVADSQGSLIFREVTPGFGYRVVVDGSSPTEASRPLHVLSIDGSQPEQSFYDGQDLQPGYGYITTRDGTQLSIFVALPGPPGDGPYPVLVNYSGYDPSQPVGQLSLGGLDLSFLCAEIPVICDAPNAPEALIAGALGYATVGVNMRGTGCSGGAYDFFEPLQLLDGYDIIETVAAQPWAGKVGMIGISFPGISQLFVASTQPPHLAAITPLAVISGVDTTMNPGGILNNGFAVQWGSEVSDRAAPYGHGWEQGQVDAGDTVCQENQLLHSQKVDIIAKAYAHPFYEPAIYDPLNPRTFVHEIQVPVFTSGAWQDEQTGSHFPDLWTRFTGAPVVKYTAYNGAHADGFQPSVLAEMKNFLDFYVRGAIVPISSTLRGLAPSLFKEVYGAPAPIPPERFSPSDDFETQRVAYEAEQPIRILMEDGGVPGRPGAPIPRWELHFDSWPPPETEAHRFYFHGDGSLSEEAPTDTHSASSFNHDDAHGQRTYVVNDAFEHALPDIMWLPETIGEQVVFLSAPFTEDTVMVGHASADLWIQSTADDADLEVMLSEVRPDGQEMYIASGWLRASQRALSPASTPLKPVQTHLEADASPLPAGEWTPVRIEIYPFAHAFRTGSQLRVAVADPGNNKGRWQFDLKQLGAGVLHAVAHSAAHPSSVNLPVIPGVAVPSPIEPCPSLRSQFCRTYEPQANAAYPE